MPDSLDLLCDALRALNEREQTIIRARHITMPQTSLEALSSQFGVSRERIRQIEVRAFEKIAARVGGSKVALAMFAGGLG